jgi:hypothetical protein
MKRTLRVGACVLTLAGALFFIYGCMKFVEAGSAAPPGNLKLEVPGVNVQVVNTAGRDRALAILGLSGLAFVAGAGVGLYSFRVGPHA